MLISDTELSPNMTAVQYFKSGKLGLLSIHITARIQMEWLTLMRDDFLVTDHVICMIYLKHTVISDKPE